MPEHFVDGRNREFGWLASQREMEMGRESGEDEGRAIGL